MRLLIVASCSLLLQLRLDFFFSSVFTTGLIHAGSLEDIVTVLRGRHLSIKVVSFASIWETAASTFQKDPDDLLSSYPGASRPLWESQRASSSHLTPQGVVGPVDLDHHRIPPQCQDVSLTHNLHIQPNSSLDRKPDKLCLGGW